MATAWTFHKGIRTIGGTVIEIDVDGHRLIFDMGRGFEPGSVIFDHELKPRGIRDLRRLGVAPAVDGIFAGDGTRDDRPTMIAVSHMHLDHMGFIPYLRADVPVLMSEDSHRLLQALDAVHDGPRTPLDIRAVAVDSLTSWGPFTIECVAVDHDCPGTTAFFITAGDLRFVYSADLRQHGKHPDYTLDFARRAHDFKPDVLFIEGTRADSEDNDHTIAETDLAQRIGDAARSTKAGVYVLFYPRHPERVDSFRAAAASSERELVLQPAHAYIYAQFGGNLTGVSLYSADLAAARPELQAWVARSGLPSVSPEDLRGSEHRFIVDMTYPRMVDFVDIEPAAGGIFLHCNGTPLGPYDPNWNNLMHWLQTFQLDFTYVGSTGHGSRTDILSLVTTIAPRVLMPIHSKSPERIGLTTVPRLMPAYGRVYTKADIDDAKCPTEADLQPLAD
ncbi:MAG: MBL fold metallo-hydrolase [Firmicutes bacterium]|nr:MBL fold metallo-hydrolase [Bacillota bacterium]